jgi:hypothetical protein
MTSNDDYELWAALMEEDNPPVPPAVPVVPVVQAPQPVAEPQKFFPLTPVQQVSAPEPAPVFIPEPAPVFIPEPAPVFIPEPAPETLVETQAWSDTAKQAIEDIQREAEFSPTPKVEDVDADLDFPTNLFKEPQTNSITMPEVPDALTAEIVTETGEVLKTGAIDIPGMVTTGSIPIITVVPDTVDEGAIQAAMGDETTAGIPPIRAGSVMNSSARVGVLPIKNRRSEGQTIILAISSILLVTMGAGVLALYMLNIIK